MPLEEPIYDLAHLAHVELLTPKPDESLRFFVDVMGMTESGREGDSVYLRGWDDYERHTLKLTAAPKPGLGYYALRAASPHAFSREWPAGGFGPGPGWSDGDLGHGPAYCFRDPDGHHGDLLRDRMVSGAGGVAPGAQEPGPRSIRRGASACAGSTTSICWRQTCAANRQFMQEYLGCRLTEQIIFDDGSEKGTG